MPLFLSEYIPRNVVLVKTVCPSRNGPNMRPVLGMKIKDRQALIDLVMKNVHRAMANESRLRLASGSTKARLLQDPGDHGIGDAG